MTDPGKYSHKVRFEEFNGAVDASGDIRDDIDANWTLKCFSWAAIDPIAGKEFYAAEQSQSEVTHKIRCRYKNGITPALRIRYGTRVFHILSVINWREANEELLLMAKELVK